MQIEVTMMNKTLHGRSALIVKFAIFQPGHSWITIVIGDHEPCTKERQRHDHSCQ